MQHIFLKKNEYRDSLALMLLSARLSDIRGVTRASVMMATPGNKDILAAGGWADAQVQAAGPNDMVVALEVETHEALVEAEKAMGDFLLGNHEGMTAARYETVRSWTGVEQAGEGYPLCILSLPGEYAAREAAQALERNKHVFLFSDHVSLEEERALKDLAAKKGLLVMGPDCGTAMIGGIPLGFANAVRRGSVGIVGASGTGMQEVMVRLHRGGQGISQAIGTGGRDVAASVGGATMRQGIAALAEDEDTRVLVVVSKPPAKEVREELLSLLRGCGKPVVVAFLGDESCGQRENLFFAPTLAAAADRAIGLCGGSAAHPSAALPEQAGAFHGKRKLLGLYTGGTLAAEAAYLAGRSLGIPLAASHADGFMGGGEGHEIWDLGDDAFTKGRPHPMIDSTVRVERLAALQDDPRDLAVLLDVVLGYGAAENPAGDLAPAIAAVLSAAKRNGSRKKFVVNLVGTRQDLQGLARQARILEEAGAHIAYGNSEAVACALGWMGYRLPPFEENLPRLPAAVPLPVPGAPVRALLLAQPGVVNIGIPSFLKGAVDGGAKALHFDWRPQSPEQRQAEEAIRFLRQSQFAGQPYATLREANRRVADRVLEAKPVLVDVVPAAHMAPVLRGKTLLHAGPPISYPEMTAPMQGSCVGAALFEGWAQSEEEARALLEGGAVDFIPCHHAGFVGPMGGITSGSMPVLKVVNQNGGNTACCTLNEGIGPVLRFGAYSSEVIDRLRFLRDEMGPVLSLALREMPEGLDIGVIVAKAIAMGDEFHQRNIAASMVFGKELAPIIAGLDIGNEKKRRVLSFLAGCEQFFLNIMMAAAKAAMDHAAKLAQGTVVTAMTRNGKDFAIRIAGMGETWFTGPVNTPEGLYFSGFSAGDANPDMGDSAITEAFGVGGMAMIAAPAVTRYVGSGGFFDALATSEAMAGICVGHNPQLPIPTWDFKGACLGIDACEVVQSGTTPVINTGIAHKQAGLGQIGAGTVRPPMDCFTKAVLAYAHSLGYRESVERNG